MLKSFHFITYLALYHGEFLLDDAVYCIDRAMFLSAGKQRSFGSFVNMGKKGSHSIPGNQILSLENQYHKDAVQIPHGIIEKNQRTT